MSSIILRINYAKQKQLGCKKVQSQSEAICKQAGATKSFDISYFIKKTFNSLNDIQYFIIYFSRLALSLGHPIIILVQKGGQVIKPIVKIYYKILYVIQGVKKFFDKIANFLASTDIKAFGRSCLLTCCF